MFSWAGRAAFFGGMVSLWCCVISCSISEIESSSFFEELIVWKS
jgi:hypothetical protein